MRALVCAVLLTTGTSQAVVGQECPDVDPAAGYPVSAASNGEVDATFLREFVYAAVHRWRVPSRRRNAYMGWERVRNRILPPEPRWAVDWKPERRHTAVLQVHIGSGESIRY